MADAAEIRAVYEIKAEAHRLTTVRILAAVEAGDWPTLARLAERLYELAQRGLYHESQERARSLGADLAQRGGDGR